jgi:hypothetical protein
MEFSQIVKDGHRLLDTVQDNDTGVMTATLSTDGKLNMAAHASEQFSVAIISVLIEQILNGNMCCQSCFMKTTMALHETLNGVVKRKIEELNQESQGAVH